MQEREKAQSLSTGLAARARAGARDDFQSDGSYAAAPFPNDAMAFSSLSVPFKDGQQLGDLRQIANALGEIGQLYPRLRICAVVASATRVPNPPLSM
jgi:hypothetical protein